jgi:L-histidine N-alpha-methyltransferase
MSEIVNDYMSSTAPYTVRRSRQQMVRDVRQGLTQNPKRLSPKYFYDEKGSELFEQITDLPEYYLTRAERALLGEVIPGLVKQVAPRSLVELGAGSASKTRVILDTMIAQGAASGYVPIDVSRDFLETTAKTLRRDYPFRRISRPRSWLRFSGAPSEIFRAKEQSPFSLMSRD